jgi:hypothetical protein
MVSVFSTSTPTLGQQLQQHGLTSIVSNLVHQHHVIIIITQIMNNSITNNQGNFEQGRFM